VTLHPYLYNLLAYIYSTLRDRAYRTDGLWIWYERGPVLSKVEACWVMYSAGQIGRRQQCNHES